MSGSEDCLDRSNNDQVSAAKRNSFTYTQVEFLCFCSLSQSDLAVNLEQPADQLFCARLLAPRHNPRQEGVPHVPPDHAQRLPPEEVQELERVAEIMGRVHQLLPLFLQNLSG